MTRYNFAAAKAVDPAKLSMNEVAILDDFNEYVGAWNCKLTELDRNASHYVVSREEWSSALVKAYGTCVVATATGEYLITIRNLKEILNTRQRGVKVFKSELAKYADEYKRAQERIERGRREQEAREAKRLADIKAKQDHMNALIAANTHPGVAITHDGGGCDYGYKILIDGEVVIPEQKNMTARYGEVAALLERVPAGLNAEQLKDVIRLYIFATNRERGKARAADAYRGGDDGLYPGTVRAGAW